MAEPEEKWPQDAVPRTVSAKAVLSEAADVRPTAAPSRSSHPSVLDGGRGSSLSLLDTTGDGQPNLVGIDTETTVTRGILGVIKHQSCGT